MILQRFPAFLRIRIDPSQQNQVILYVRTSYFCASTKAYLRSIRDRMVISQIDAGTLLSRPEPHTKIITNRQHDRTKSKQSC